jgi:hypothetical protein
MASPQIGLAFAGVFWRQMRVSWKDEPVGGQYHKPRRNLTRTPRKSATPAAQSKNGSQDVPCFGAEKRLMPLLRFSITHTNG